MSAPIIGRAGVIGDVHGEDFALQAAIEVMRLVGVDAILCVGDVADGYGDVDRCCELLERGAVVTVMGNHDRWCLASELRTLPQATTQLSDASRRFLSGLPTTVEITTTAGAALLCHGIGDDDMSELRPDTSGYALQQLGTLRELMMDERIRYLIGGHTHVEMVRRFAGLTVVNAGTLHRECGPGFCIVDFTEGRVERFSWDGTSCALRGTEALPPPAPLR